MRTLIVSLAAAASALAVAAPAQAQWAPQGHAYGYNNYGHVRSLQARIDNVQRQIKRADARNIISDREADRLKQQARDLENRLRYSARNGLHPREAQNIEQRLARIEQRLFRDARDGRNQWGNNGWSDRDRDGRHDRYEDDRGRDRD